MTINEPLVISTQGLGKSYKGVDALQSLDLAVQQNSIFGFLGPNGAGKTTTIKLLLGLARPTRGRGTIFGQDIVRDSVNILSNVGYLPQDPRFYEHMTARQILDYTAKFYFQGPQSEINNRIDEMLDLVGLTARADRSIKGFSGGERQRLGIAQAEINYPDLLILDEPAAALDPQGRRDVLEIIKRLRKHTTVFFSTHILDDVQRVSDTVAILNKGQLVIQAPIEELLAGSEETVYSVTVRGNLDKVPDDVQKQTWVSKIEASQLDNQTTWQISVNNKSFAEEQLLRLIMANGGVTVTNFGRKENNLEDVFLSLVEGSQQ